MTIWRKTERFVTVELHYENPRSLPGPAQPKEIH